MPSLAAVRSSDRLLWHSKIELVPKESKLISNFFKILVAGETEVSLCRKDFSSVILVMF